MTDYSDFIVFLARQRSGTHVARSVLESHPEIGGVEEIFHLASASNPGTGPQNFFEFLKRQAGDDALKLLPVDYERFFLDYLEDLRHRNSKRFLLLDVKYNTVHHVARNFQDLTGVPYLFELILKHGLRTFILTRRHYLRAFLSMAKANANNTFHVTQGEKGYVDKSIELNIYELVYQLKNWRAEDELVRSSFTEYPKYRNWDYSKKLLTWDYAELATASGDGISSDFLEAFASWLDLPNLFTNQARFQKQSSLGLRQAILNYEEVARALRRAGFGYCLRDETFGGRKPQSWFAKVSKSFR